MKPNEGYVFQRGNGWVARVSYTDASGKRREKWRTGKSEQHARELLAGLIASLDIEKAAVANPKADTSPLFKTIAAQYSALKVQPATYRNNRKISGMRSIRTVKLRMAVLVSHFGEMPVASITPAVIERWKNARLSTPTKHGTERAIASVNRELETLRAILRYARNEGIIQASPFERASTPIISKAYETKRTRVLTTDEETKLLAACEAPRRRHLLPIVIAAIDTGARKGELLAIRWSDIDPLRSRITLRSETTKTQQTRIVTMSNRLCHSLFELACERNGCKFIKLADWIARHPDETVFNLRKFQNGWNAACADAKIVDLRFHDLRATFITRLVEQGMPVELVAKLSGHSDVATLYAHYLRKSDDALQWAKRLLDKPTEFEDSEFISTSDDYDMSDEWP